MRFLTGIWRKHFPPVHIGKDSTRLLTDRSTTSKRLLRGPLKNIRLISKRFMLQSHQSMLSTLENKVQPSKDKNSTPKVNISQYH